MKLNRQKFYVGKQKAEQHIIHLARHLEIKVPKRKNFSKDIELKGENKIYRINFTEEINEVIETGRSLMLQQWFDAQDRFLQPTLEMSIESNVPGLEITMKSSLGSHTAQASTEGLLEAPDLALARDICYYHKQTCELFNNGDKHGFTRSFRGFLHSCIALVDCFLFRYTFHLKEMKVDTSKYINTVTLDSKARIEDRLDAWMQAFAAVELEHFPNWKERSQFIELKAKRNEFTHPTTPSVSFEPKEVAKLLNYGATGIGGLLARMRKASQTSDRIGFIYQIHHLPRVLIAK